MSEIAMSDFRGLVTAPGLLERAPASFIDVTNFEFPAPGLITKRRGFRRLSGSAGGPIWSLFNSMVMGANVLAHIGGSGGVQLRYGDGSGALALINTVDSVDLVRTRETRMQLAMCERNHYLTADNGVARVGSDMATARYAGMPRGLGVKDDMSLTNSVNWLADGYSRAYRVTYHRKDADGVELGGAPTARWVATNASFVTGHSAGNSRSPTFSVRIPSENGTRSTALAADAYVMRLWGTRSFNEVGSGQQGDDEMYLITEHIVNSGDIAAGYVTITDETPDEYLTGSPTLHTNLYNFPPGEAGIRQGVVNEDAPPPEANTIAYWQDCMWYGDTERRASIAVALIANLADGDTVTVEAGGTSVTLTAKTVPTLATHFQIWTSPPTSTLDIRGTTRAMVDCIHVNLASAGMRPFHVSTAATQPGLVFMEAARGNLSISFASSAATKWQAFGGYALGAAASPVAAANGLMFSKPSRADAVPPINEFIVGPTDAQLVRIFPYRERLLLFTTKGIYQAVGRSYADFQVMPFDLGFRLLGRELVAECDEKIYAWCYEGIVEIDAAGVRVVSAPIEPTIENLLFLTGQGPSRTVSEVKLGWKCVAALGFAVAYRQAHQVRFHYPQTDDPTNLQACHYWLSFDTRTRTWAVGEFPRTTFAGWYDARSAGCVRLVDDILMLGSWTAGTDYFLFAEKREYAASDYIDTARNGDTAGVYSSITTQFQVPDARGAQHWQQTVWNWDSGEFSWRTPPTSVTASYETEVQSAVLGPLGLTGASLTRVEPTLTVRRGQRLRVALLHEEAEYAGVVGISQSFRSGTQFARRVTR